MAIHNMITYPVEEVRRRIHDGETQEKIAVDLAERIDPRISAKLIYKLCKRHGIVCQRTGPRSGEAHPQWEGGRIVTKHGYVKIYRPEHPSCVRYNEKRKAESPGKYVRLKKYVWEHRLVMESKLGRILGDSEVVHHLNGVRDDNRSANLMVFQTNAEHLAFDLKGKCPNWSPVGKVATQSGVQKWRAKRRQMRELDAPERQQNFSRQTM